MEDVQYSEIQRRLRDTARMQSRIVGAGRTGLFCESPAFAAAAYGKACGDAGKRLRDMFGYEHFRPLQKDVVSCVMLGRDTLAVMPDGGGKSLCYQLAALLLGGMTVVISPFREFLENSVVRLRSRLGPAGVEVVCLHARLSVEDYGEGCHKLEDACMCGKGAMLYLPPEALREQRVRHLLSRLHEQIRLFVINEAHCVSRWGNDFRPDYLGICHVRRNFPKASFLALTGSATGAVRQDIIRCLRLERPEVLLSGCDGPVKAPDA